MRKSQSKSQTQPQTKPIAELTAEQQVALDLLRSGENVFLTGGAGCGKSFVIRQYMQEISFKETPLLASTGAAAVLVGGRTFHSFFALGILEGGLDATIERAIRDRRLQKRLGQVEGIIIDEISMISGEALRAAESISRLIRGSQHPWGGMRVIAVGDFAQLPPVSKISSRRDWCFLTDTWGSTNFRNFALQLNQRVQDHDYLRILGDLRVGKVTREGFEYLNSRTKIHDEEDDGVRLFPRRAQSEDFNTKRLNQLPGAAQIFEAVYMGEARYIETLKKNSPVPEKLVLKEGAQVIFLQNDPMKRWVNGTRGIVTALDSQVITVEVNGRRELDVERSSFSLQDAEGNVVASQMAFPLTLAYASTIHKSQGATLEKIWVDLKSLWEPGQAYVALSRLPLGQGLNLLGWSPRSIIVDEAVKEFYKLKS